MLNTFSHQGNAASCKIQYTHIIPPSNPTPRHVTNKSYILLVLSFCGNIINHPLKLISSSYYLKKSNFIWEARCPDVGDKSWLVLILIISFLFASGYCRGWTCNLLPKNGLLRGSFLGKIFLLKKKS